MNLLTCLKGAGAGALACAAALLTTQVASAQSMEWPKNLPRTIVWTSYDVGGAGYNMTAAMGHTMSQHAGLTVRVIPSGTDPGRQLPVATGRAHFGFFGAASFLSTEGVMEFAAPDWGPQRLRLLAVAWDKFNTGVMSCAGDAGIKTIFDVKGKRLAWVHGGAALNLNLTAFLHAANYTWDDVQKVEFPSFAATMRAIREGDVDCVTGSTNTAGIYELANSPRKYQPAHMPRPEENPDAWKRLQSVAPYFSFNEGTIGAPPVSPENPHIGATYGYPIVAAYDRQDPELVYHQTKLIVELEPHYRNAFPGLGGFAAENQRLSWVIPYHEGAVRYFKEIGRWTAEDQANNDLLIKRQDLLTEAWDKALAEREAQKVKVSDFPKLWMQIRAEALEAAGMNPYWKDIFW